MINKISDNSNMQNDAETQTGIENPTREETSQNERGMDAVDYYMMAESHRQEMEIKLLDNKNIQNEKKISYLMIENQKLKEETRKIKETQDAILQQLSDLRSLMGN